MEKAKVYFSKEITPESVVKMYEKLGVTLPGKVAVKLHSGEKENQNYGCVISPKYFPVSLGQGIFAIEETYKEKYWMLLAQFVQQRIIKNNN